MTLFEPSATTAAVAAATGFALLVGHMLGDHPVQPDTVAVAKGQPSDDRLAAGAHPWTGWSAIGRHVSSYVLTQGVALLLIALVAPLSLHGAVAALAVSASTHAVIDRRWIVRAIIRRKGCQNWADAAYWIDQSLHYGALLVAAITAALVTTYTGGVATVLACAVLVAAALAAERIRATGLSAQPAPSDRL
jgi:hypothetical protein